VKITSLCVVGSDEIGRYNLVVCGGVRRNRVVEGWRGMVISFSEVGILDANQPPRIYFLEKPGKNRYHFFHFHLREKL